MNVLRLALATALCVTIADPSRAVIATSAPTAGKRPTSSVRFIDSPSTETPAAREKRLRRECQGRPNAGMCLGHTR